VTAKTINHMNISLKKIEVQDLDRFIELIRLFEDVFEMENFDIPDHSHLQGVLHRPDFLCMVAIAENQVVGGLTGYVLHQYYSTQPLAYIYDLAVKRDFQRQGVGKKLINGFVEHCKDRGFEEVFVQADKVDDYALDFYRSTGITEEEQVVHFYYKFKK
jgi:aminoglycoside 3-N-acetyltransferase I